MGILRHGEAQSLCEAAAALPAALSFPCRTDSDGFTFVVVSEFAYYSRGTVIHFLNDELPVAITSAFNGRRGQREAGTGLLFQRLHQDNITDLVKRELLLALSWGVQEDYPIVPITLCAPGISSHSWGRRVGSPPKPRHGSSLGRLGEASRGVAGRLNPYAFPPQ